MITKSNNINNIGTINEIVKKSETVGTIDDLYVRPVTFKNGIQTMFQDRVAIFTPR